MWVFAGAFQEVRKNINKNIGIGFQSKDLEAKQKTLAFKSALISTGVLTELISRISTFIEVKELDKKGLLNILLNERSYYKTTQTSLKDLGISFVHDIDKLLNRVYTIAKENKIGARAINEVIDEDLQRVVFEYPAQMQLIVEYFQYLEEGAKLEGNMITQLKRT